jgi:signal transduction histidine kinase
MDDGVYIVNRQYKIEYINPVIEKEFGRVDGRRCYKYLHDRNEPCPWCKNKRVFSGDIVQWEWYCSRNDKDYELFDTPIINCDGSISKLEIFHDVTKRKRLEEEIKTANVKLQKKVEEAIAENRARDQLMYEQSRHISMGELLINISHHWRQPLCSVGLLVQDIRDAWLHKELDETYLNNNIERAMSELKALSDTIDDFRNFYIHAKEQKEFNISDEINKADTLISGYVREKAIVIDKELDEGLTVQGYPNEFAEVILNILTNARDKFERMNVTGGIIKIRLYRDGATGRKIITITDNGGEIADDIINKVFDPYFTTKDKARGTGMGLYMAKVIIEKNMNGTLSIGNIGGWCELRIEL